MVRRLIALAACAGAVAVPMAAKAQDAYFGPQIGFFFPSSAAMRDALGDSWFSFGASRIRIFDVNQAKWSHDWSAINQRRDGNSIFILTGSMGYAYPLSAGTEKYKPYFAIRGGISYIDYAITTGGGRKAGKRFGLNGNTAIGVNIDRRINIEARYDVFSAQDGLSFDGLTLYLRVGIARF